MTTKGLDINNLAAVGVIRDLPPYQLPPEVWNQAYNVRFQNGGVERLLGFQQVFGTPTVPPYFAIPVVTSAQVFWVYAGLQKVYAFDGSSHTNITRQSVGVDVNYTATEAAQWNGTILGGVLILNNGVDLPQNWVSPPTVGTRLTDLPNWDTDWRAKIIRAFGPFLVAFNITDAGSNFGSLVQWSHPADPGSVPSSWDYTDPTVDAGRNDLPDVNAGVILEALPLAGRMYIYKGSSVWRMSFIGGRFIFDFKAFLETTGILAPRCVAATPDGLSHVVATNDDILIHNGVKATSLLSRRMQKTVFSALDSTNYTRSFMFANPAKNEIWFCYPTSGSSHPDRALIYNVVEGGISEADCNFQNAALGDIETPDETIWSGDSGTWNGLDDGPWTESDRRKVVLVSPVAEKLYQMDEGNTRDGSTFTATLQRTGLALIGRDRENNWIEDHEVWKLFRGVWPKVQGGPVNIRVGAQSFVDGSVTWQAPVSFDPTDMIKVDHIASGRALAIEFETTAAAFWRLDGYKPDIEKMGQF